MLLYVLLAVYNPHVLLRTRLVDRYPSVYVAVFITGCIQITIHMFYLGHG